MTTTERIQVGETLLLTGKYYGREIAKETLSMMLDDLDDLDFSRVIAALAQYRRDAKNRMFPLPAQIRAMINPEVDADAAAKEIAARIAGAIVKFGYNNSSEAKFYIGDIGWSVVQRFGGWTYLCQNHGSNIDPTAFMAQARELAKGAIMYSPEAMARAICIAPNIKRGELQSVGEIMEIPSTAKSDTEIA